MTGREECDWRFYPSDGKIENKKKRCAGGFQAKSKRERPKKHTDDTFRTLKPNLGLLFDRFQCNFVRLQLLSMDDKGTYKFNWFQYLIEMDE